MLRAASILAVAVLACACSDSSTSDATPGTDAAPGADARADAGPSGNDALPGADANHDAGTTDAAAEDAATPDADTPDLGPGVRVENEGLVAIYHDTDGTPLAVLPTPSEYPIPDGAMVTLVADRLITLTDVPPLARIQIRYGGREPSQPRQSIRVDVAPEPSGANIAMFNGCVFAPGPGVHTLAVETDCLAPDDTAELWIFGTNGAAGGYIHVDDIAVGAASLPPLDVALPAWSPWPATPPVFDIDRVPQGQTASVNHYTMRGFLPLMNVTTSFEDQGGSHRSTIFTVIPELGLEWYRHLYFTIDGPGPFDTWPNSGIHELVGHPLPLTSSTSVDRLLPLAAEATYTGPFSSVSWSFAAPLPAEVDRVRVVLTDSAQVLAWEIWAQPSRTSFTFPTIPAEHMGAVPPDVAQIMVRAEDREGISTWVEVLDRYGPELNVFSSPWDGWPLGRYSTILFDVP